MRMFFLFLLLFIPLTANAINCTGNSNCAAGCYLSNAGCKECPADHYCTGGSAQPQECPSDFPSSTDGNAEIESCYKPCSSNSDSDAHSQCGITQFADNLVSCQDTNGVIVWSEPSELYHLEGTDGCYLNSRPCNLFNAKDNNGSEISGDNKDNIFGNAVYDETNQTYNVDSCYYTKTIESNADNSHNSGLWCDSEDKYSVSNNTDANANTVLAFNTLNGYYCTACEQGSNTYPTDNTTGTQNCIAPDSSHYKACKCIPIEAGRYGDCSNWNYSNQLSQCPISNCPVGQTTGNTGGTTINDCHYTNDTKICVGENCIPLNQMESNGTAIGVSPSQWKSN